MTTVLHIGPPKTATTSLQESIIPHLGRPYVIKPAWARELARRAEFPRPVLEPGTILSDEILGEFSEFTPEVIADRLAPIAPGGRVIFTQRDTVEMFISLYKQMVISLVYRQVDLMQSTRQIIVVSTPDAVFDSVWKDYHTHGRGFFAMTDMERLKIAFGRHFDVRIIAFSTLNESPAAFVREFCEACGVKPAGEISVSNVTTMEKVELAFSELPSGYPAAAIDYFREAFRAPKLSADRVDFLRAWPEPIKPAPITPLPF